MKYKILIAEDNQDIANILKLYLESNNYQVITTYDGEQALKALQTEKIDLAILDIMMPKIDGFTLLKEIRKTLNIPIIMLTAKIEDNDKILGLNLGADDYVTKPFNPLELIARVNANLRRTNHQTTRKNPTITIRELELDTEKLTLKKNGQEIIITPNEYKLLLHLMKNPDRVFTKSQLCEAINGEYYENYDNSIMVHISHLREKIEEDPKNPSYIKNVRGVGYKIEK